MALDPLTALLEVGGTLIDRLVPDKGEADKLRMELAVKAQELAAQSDTQQTEINKIEAASEDRFTRRWRPFIGWTCGVAFSYHFVLQPFLAFILANTGHEVVLPDFDIDSINAVLFGMLGLGGLRTVEKVSGKVATVKIAKLPWRK